MQSTRIGEHIIIHDVNVWNPDGVLTHQDVEVKSGKIVSIKPAGPSSVDPKVIPASGLTLMPLGVDPQVHLRVPGQPEKETAATGLKAALAGGIGAILTMPNTKPVIDTPEVLALARAEVANADYANEVKVLYSAAITMQQRGKESVDFLALAEAGAAAFTDDGLGVVSDDMMRAAFAASEETGLPILQHAEFPGHGGVLAPSQVQADLGLDPAYDERAEVDMVSRDLRLLKDYPSARYHVLHVSSAKTVDLVAAAKAAGFHASCEVSPHHLTFTGDDIKRANSAFKMNPPLRSKQDVAKLRAAIADGRIDFVATDHAPHEPEAKSMNFKTAAFGTIGLETSLRCLLAMRASGELTPERLVQVFSTKPAEFLGIEADYGRLGVGRPFQAILLDAEAAPAPFSPMDIQSKSHNSCFLGHPLPGRIIRVFTPSRMISL